MSILLSLFNFFFSFLIVFIQYIKKFIKILFFFFLIIPVFIIYFLQFYHINYQFNLIHSLKLI